MLDTYYGVKLLYNLMLMYIKTGLYNNLWSGDKCIRIDGLWECLAVAIAQVLTMISHLHSYKFTNLASSMCCLSKKSLLSWATRGDITDLNHSISSKYNSNVQCLQCYEWLCANIRRRLKLGREVLPPPIDFMQITPFAWHTSILGVQIRWSISKSYCKFFLHTACSKSPV